MLVRMTVVSTNMENMNVIKMPFKNVLKNFQRRVYITTVIRINKLFGMMFPAINI